MSEEKTHVQEINDLIKEYKKNDSKVYDWMIKPCKIYKAEYKECRSVKGRFQQYFIEGAPIECDQWETDYKNCLKYEKKKDEDAKVELLESEMERRNKRMQAHYGNDTWKNRTNPPEDWNKPLPKWIVKRDQYSYLSIKAEEIRNETSKFIYPDSGCIIL